MYNVHQTQDKGGEKSSQEAATPRVHSKLHAINRI